jgi:type VI protein secretion system component Hcp
MAKEDSTDIFMIFKEEKKGSPLPGGSTTELKIKGSPRNDLLKGFEPLSMFEISKFDFGVGVAQQAVEEFEYPGLKAALAAVPGVKPPARKPRAKSVPGQTLDESPVTIQPVSFTRRMDRASSVLLHHTIKRTYFEHVALVKRKAAGGAAAGEAYLRLDFEGVILIEANWSDDDPIEETYAFQARAITMRYKPQLPDGKLGAAKVGFWSMVPNAVETRL